MIPVSTVSDRQVERENLRTMNTKEKVIKNILVGVDFSDPSASAVTEAVRLARQQRGRVYILHIVEESMIEAIEKFSHLNQEEIISSVSSRLDSFCRDLIGAKEDLKTIVKLGHPVKEFANVADQLNPDLVVLGAWGQEHDTEKSSGTTVKQIVQECTTDVLLMRPRKVDHFSKVVACLDFSNYDVSIIRAADQLCLADKGSLELLHVFYPPWKVAPLADEDKVVVTGDFEAEYEAVLQGRLDELVPLNEHGIAGFNTTTHVIEHARHSEGILQYLKREEADVVVVGARGTSKIESMILGRIAERVLTESPSSVYVVKNLADDRE